MEDRKKYKTCCGTRPINEEEQINVIEPEIWMEYFENLYWQPNNKANEEKEGSPTESSPAKDVENDKITLEDIKIAIRQLKTRKSPDIDKITNELIKYEGIEIVKGIANLFQKIKSYGTVPKNWKESIIIPIYKKGPKNNPANYKGITLLNSIQKLMTKILTQKITNKINISEEQQGFRVGRSTTDAIFVLR